MYTALHSSASATSSRGSDAAAGDAAGIDGMTAMFYSAASGTTSTGFQATVTCETFTPIPLVTPPPVRRTQPAAGSVMITSQAVCLYVSLSLYLSISLSLYLSVSLSLCLSVSLFVYYICGRWGSGSGRGSLPKRPTEFTGVCAPGRARRRWPTETVCWVAAAAVREQRPELPGVGRDGAVHHQFRLHALRVQAGLRGPRNAAALEPLSP